MNTIKKLLSGNVEFLSGNTLINSFLQNSEVLEGGKEYQITISNTGNHKMYSFDWQKVTLLITPFGNISVPTTKNEFIKVLVESFFFSGSYEVVQLNQVLEDLKTIIKGQESNNFYYFQFPFNVDFSSSPQLTDNFVFSYFDGQTQQTYSENLSGTVVNSLEELCTILNTNQNIFIFKVPNDLTQIENYTVGNTTILIEQGTTPPTAYINDSLEITLNLGAINGDFLEGFTTPSSIEQKQSLQQQILNENLFYYLSGANYQTPNPQFTTRAAVTGTNYMLMGLKALENVTIVLKEAEILASTNDNSVYQILKNPTISTAPSVINNYEGSVLNMLQVTAGTPTPCPQVVTGGVLVSIFTGVANSYRSKNINRKIFLQKDDILILTAQPESANLDVKGFISWLE